MKITKVGQIIINAEGPIQYNNFDYLADETESKFSTETLTALAAQTVTEWALKRLKFEVDRAKFEVIKKLATVETTRLS